MYQNGQRKGGGTVNYVPELGGAGNACNIYSRTILEETLEETCQVRKKFRSTKPTFNNSLKPPSILI